MAQQPVRNPKPAHPAILSAAAIAALIPFAARILFTCAAFLADSTLIVPMYLPWSSDLLHRDQFAKVRLSDLIKGIAEAQASSR